MKEHLESLRDVSYIALDAAKLIISETVEWVGDKADSWLAKRCDLGDIYHDEELRKLAGK